MTHDDKGKSTADTSKERDDKKETYDTRRDEQLGDEKGTSGKGSTKR